MRQSFRTYGRDFGMALVAGALAMACATFSPNATPYEKALTRAEDVRVNTLSIYDSTMAFHMQHSAEETPVIYKDLEILRHQFPPAHREYVATLGVLKSVKDGNPQDIHVKVVSFLTGLKAWGDDKWKAQIDVIIATWEGGH